MEKKELKKRIVEYVSKNISYGYGDCSFQIDYTSPDGVEYIYEEDDAGDINPTFMEFLEDFALDVIQQEIDRANLDLLRKIVDREGYTDETIVSRIGKEFARLSKLTK